MSDFSEFQQLIISDKIKFIDYIIETKFTTETFNKSFGSIVMFKQIYKWLSKKLKDINYQNKDNIMNELLIKLENTTISRPLLESSHIVAQPLFSIYAELCDILEVLDENRRIQYFDGFMNWVNLNSYIVEFYKT